MFRSLYKIWKPEIFQGNLKNKNYFEGWYFKLVDPSSENVYAFIPGVSIRKEDNSHAFIQVLNGKTAESWYIPFETDQFKYHRKTLQIQMDKNIFSRQGLELNINHQGLELEGNISFGTMIPWPVRLTSPGVMGWYAFVPFMECYHGVVSFDHSIHGFLKINGRKINFDDGKGYIEKDWGTSFPKYYIWIQSNHFDRDGISLMASVANIPWLGSSFDGFIFGFYFEGKVYRFTTYTGAKIKSLKFSDKEVLIQVTDKNYLLEMKATSKTEGGLLKAPNAGAMTDRIRENMNSTVEVKLKNIKSEELIYSGTGYNTGFEMGGDLNQLKEI